MVGTVLNGKYPKNVYVRRSSLFLTKEETQKFIQKYAPSKSLQELQNGDTIVLASYPIFRKDNSKIVEQLNKVKDSIRFSFFLRKGRHKHFIKEIIW